MAKRMVMEIGYVLRLTINTNFCFSMLKMT